MNQKQINKLAELMKSVAGTLKTNADSLEMLLNGKVKGDEDVESFIVDLIVHTKALQSEVCKFHKNLI